MTLHRTFGIKIPLIVAPMAGGPTTPELVIASCNAGALGSMGAAYSTPPAIEEFAAKVRAQTESPFAINLFVPHPEPQINPTQLRQAIEVTEIFRQEFHLPPPDLKPPYEENFDAQFEAVLKIKPRVLSFIFGALSKECTLAAKKAGIQLIGTATSFDEAMTLMEAQVDAITLQGVESGGHRGLFDPTQQDPELPVIELLQTCRQKIHLPLIAAGGIMNATDIQRVRENGADAVQMGTAFLAVKEAGTSAAYRKKLLDNAERKTKTTRAFSGRLARGIENRFMLEVEKHPEAILPFPAQNKFTRDIRNASNAANSPECLSLWSGTGVGSLWTGSTAELIKQCFSDYKH